MNKPNQPEEKKLTPEQEQAIKEAKKKRETIIKSKKIVTK